MLFNMDVQPSWFLDMKSMNSLATMVIWWVSRMTPSGQDMSFMQGLGTGISALALPAMNSSIPSGVSTEFEMLIPSSDMMRRAL